MDLKFTKVCRFSLRQNCSYVLLVNKKNLAGSEGFTSPSMILKLHILKGEEKKKLKVESANRPIFSGRELN